MSKKRNPATPAPAVRISTCRPHNSIPADAFERISEIAEILAAGLIRLHARQSSHLSPHSGDSLLDCPGHQSGHANALTNDGGLG